MLGIKIVISPQEDIKIWLENVGLLHLRNSSKLFALIEEDEYVNRNTLLTEGIETEISISKNSQTIIASSNLKFEMANSLQNNSCYDLPYVVLGTANSSIVTEHIQNIEYILYDVSHSSTNPSNNDLENSDFPIDRSESIDDIIDVDSISILSSLESQLLEKYDPMESIDSLSLSDILNDLNNAQNIKVDDSIKINSIQIKHSDTDKRKINSLKKRDCRVRACKTIEDITAVNRKLFLAKNVNSTPVAMRSYLTNPTTNTSKSSVKSLSKPLKNITKSGKLKKDEAKSSKLKVDDIYVLPAPSKTNMMAPDNYEANLSFEFEEYSAYNNVSFNSIVSYSEGCPKPLKTTPSIPKSKVYQKSFTTVKKGRYTSDVDLYAIKTPSRINLSNRHYSRPWEQIKNPFIPKIIKLPICRSKVHLELRGDKCTDHTVTIPGTSLTIPVCTQHNDTCDNRTPLIGVNASQIVNNSDLQFNEEAYDIFQTFYRRNPKDKTTKTIIRWNLDNCHTIVDPPVKETVMGLLYFSKRQGMIESKLINAALDS